MQEVAAGRLLADRYALETRRAHMGSLEVWSATDTTLGREVSVTVFPDDMARTDAVLDAARRSAAVADPRFVRMLDVGSADGLNWLVEESLSESVTVAHLLEDGPLPVEEARRITGEVASALEVARRSGLHHRRLTPHAVRRTGSGLVKIAGLAIAAALEGMEPVDDATASREDTVATAALLYAALTARWPLERQVTGMEPAPRAGQGAVPPSRLATVPPDLDAACRATLAGASGPATPQELADRIAPWPTRQVDPEPARPATPPARPRSDGPEATQVIPAVAKGTGAVRARKDTPGRSAGISGAAAGSAAAAGRPAATDVPQEPQGVFARAAAARREQKEKERQARIAAERRRLEERRADPGFLDLPEALEERLGARNEGPLVPLLPAEATSGPRNTRLVFGLVTGAMVLCLAVAVPVLKGAVAAATRPTPTRSAPSDRPSASPSSKASSSTASPSPSSSSAAGLQVASVTGFDPQGDGSENDDRAERVLDDDPSTMWRSQRYKQPFSDGGKEGVGVALELKDPGTVSAVQLTLADQPQDVTVYAGTKADLDSATEIGSVSDATGEQEIKAGKPVQDAKYVVVWVTRAAEEDGGHRAMVAEVRPR